MTDCVRLAVELDRQREGLSADAVARYYARDPGLKERYGERGFERCVADTCRHLAQLARALETDEPGLWRDYVAWTNTVLLERGIPTEDLGRSLESLYQVLRDRLGGGSDLLPPFFAEATRALQAPASPQPSFLDETVPLGAFARAYLGQLLRWEHREARATVHAALDQGFSLRDVYVHVFQATQYEVGRLWQLNQITVAQEHYCTAATQVVMSELHPRVFSGVPGGRSLLATSVAGNLHELGPRMVADLFEMNGWSTIYLGANTPLPGVLQTVEALHPDVVALSVTMVEDLPALAALIQALRALGSEGGPLILVGGYPLQRAPSLAAKLGADGTAQDAPAAIALAERLSCA